MSALHKFSPERKTTFNQGYLVPVGVFEALPGDSYQHDVTALLRCQPLLAPVMHKFDISLHNWFVPYRLIHEDFEDFITGGRDGRDNTVLPWLTLDDVQTGSLANHLGLPVTTNELETSALPFRAYAMIYNEFYRDQDLQDPVGLSFASGEDTTTNKELLRGCWGKDYYTSARPNTQKGDPVEIPLTGDAPIRLNASNTTVSVEDGSGNPKNLKISGGTANLFLSPNTLEVGSMPLEADLSEVSALSINDMRLAVKLQVYKENMLRHGSRYVERLMAAFGVRPQDSRLQLPEYLGGGRQTIQFSEVLQTAEGTETPVGEMRGHGIASMRANRYKRYIPEYGVVITLMTVRPRTAYQNGIPKMFLRKTKEDFFQPELAHIGMQAIQNAEIHVDHADPTGVFGFQDRDDSYRYMYDTVSGEFTDTLDFWTGQRQLPSTVALNSEFVTCEGVDRIFATNADQFLVRVKHNLSMKRKVPAVGKPMVF